MLKCQSQKPDRRKYLWIQGSFQSPANYAKPAITGLPVGELSTAPAGSLCPLPLVGMRDCRGDGHSGASPSAAAFVSNFQYYTWIGNQPKVKCSFADFYQDSGQVRKYL